jgi:hypothetical protein
MNSFHFMSVLYLGLEMRNEKVAIWVYQVPFLLTSRKWMNNLIWMIWEVKGNVTNTFWGKYISADQKKFRTIKHLKSFLVGNRSVNEPRLALFSLILPSSSFRESWSNRIKNLNFAFHGCSRPNWSLSCFLGQFPSPSKSFDDKTKVKS